MNTFLNIIIPTYNASATIRFLTEQLERELTAYDFRILLIDDASTDDTQKIIGSLAEKYPNIDFYFSPKNRGQQASLLTGLRMISEPCRFILTMDDDLQNPVGIIPSLIDKIQSGYDIVYAVPVVGESLKGRNPSLIRRMGSGFRDRLFNSFSSKPPEIKVSSFRILTWDLANKIAKSKRKFFYLSAEAFQYPIRAANVSYAYVPRQAGRSSYHLGKLLNLYIKLLLSYKLKLF